MVSFVLIGYNEGHVLADSLSAIQSFCLTEDEIIYVDSGSSDESLAIAKDFNVKIITIEGQVNAAIARNVGVEKSSGENVVIIDADCKVLNFDRKRVVEGDSKTVLTSNLLERDLISGNVYKRSDFRDIQGDQEIEFKGAIFAAKRVVFDKHKFDSTMRKSQDYLFCSKIRKSGLKLVLTDTMLFEHQTIPYTNKYRLKNDVLSGVYLFHGLLIRKSCLDYSVLFKILQLYGKSWSILSLLLISKYFTLIVILFYAFRCKLELRQIIYSILRDISPLIGLFYLPKEPEYRIRCI